MMRVLQLIHFSMGIAREARDLYQHDARKKAARLFIVNLTPLPPGVSIVIKIVNQDG